jgi:hypothetical protein
MRIIAAIVCKLRSLAPIPPPTDLIGLAAIEQFDRASRGRAPNVKFKSRHPPLVGLGKSGSSVTAAGTIMCGSRARARYPPPSLVRKAIQLEPDFIIVFCDVQHRAYEIVLSKRTCPALSSAKLHSPRTQSI